MGQLILILGGARSGKSTFAQDLAQEIGQDHVLFVATAQASDEEMKRRIEQHRRERPPTWKTLEADRHVGQRIEVGHDDAGAILVDCMTVLTSNRLIAFQDAFADEAEAAVMGEAEDLVTCARNVPGTVIVVSNEVGMGLVPPYPLGRSFRDLLGKANQTLARHADKVFLLIAGLPLPLKDNAS